MTRCDLVFQTTGGSVPSISASLQKKRDKRGFSGSGSPRDLELVTYRNELNDQFSLLPIPLMVKVSLSLCQSLYHSKRSQGCNVLFTQRPEQKFER